jgi:pyrroline-5-carboxylate reductase
MTPRGLIQDVAVLGVGAMGGSIVRGLLEPGTDIQGGFRVSDTWSGRVAELGGFRGVTGFDSSVDRTANIRAVTGADVVILAVKPQQLSGLLGDIGDALAPARR